MGCEETKSFSLDWDQNFTEEVIQSMDAIEATLHSSSSSSPSSLVKKRKSTSHQENNPKTRRQLPDSIVSPPPSFPFSFSCCQGILPGKAAVMQICCDNRYCYVMHIIHSGIPQSLQVLLEDSTIIKAGVAIGGDAVKVFNDYNVSVKALEDLSHLGNQKINRDRQNWSLAALTEKLVCKELPKPKRIRLGNWELYPLSKEQLQYAATDAFASWHLYQVLKSLPDVEKDPEDKRSEGIPTQ
ncbi:hypothetical protein CRYUN_Cryun36dG0030300 [Craigia yunnanensis]